MFSFSVQCSLAGGYTWSFAMIILNSKEDTYDAEMLLYTITLINKVPSALLFAMKVCTETVTKNTTVIR